MAEALYRKYRPQVFADVVGQEHIERTLKNAIDQDKVSHAYLFTGPRGTGKTTTARLLAKALLCESGPTSEPDGTCEECELIAAGEHPDVSELDAASRTGVENVREEIIGRVQYAPTRGRYKVYIIDEVHMLSTAAFNALLKTLEEPPSHVVFILATTDPQKVPETIQSRCQRFDFRRISAEEILSRLGAICTAEDVEFDPEALDLIAHRAEGGMRNALSSLEQLIAYGNGKVSMKFAERMFGSLDSSDMAEIVRFIGTRDAAKCFTWTSEFVETGSDLAQFTRDLAEHMRNMYVMSLTDADVALEIGDDQRKELVEELPMYGPDRLARILGILGDLLQELKTSTNARLSFEVALTRMIRPQTDLTLESLAERVEELEAGRPAVSPAMLLNGAGNGGQALQAQAQSQPQATQPQVTQAQPQRQPQAAQAQPQVSAQAAQPQPQVQPQVQVTQSQPQVSQASQAQTAQASQPPAVQAAASATAQSSAGGGSAAPATAPSASTEGEGVTVFTFGDPVDPIRAEQYQNESAVQRTWKKVNKAFREGNEARAVLLLNATASFDASAGRFVVDIPAPGAFLANMAKDPKTTEALQAAFAQAEDAPLPFTLIIRQLDAAGSSAKVQAVSREEAAPTPSFAAAETAQQAVAAQPVTQPAAAQPATAQPAETVSEAQPTAAQAVTVSAEAGNQPTAAQAQQPSEADPFYDQVPLDAYDAYAVPGDTMLSDIASSNAAAGNAAPGDATPPWETEPTGGSSAGESAPSPAGSASAGAAAPADPTTDELNATLASTFGDGLVFEPLD